MSILTYGTIKNKSSAPAEEYNDSIAADLTAAVASLTSISFQDECIFTPGFNL